MLKYLFLKRHLISSTKFVINYAQFAIRNPSHDNYNLWLDKCNHALKFLKQAHWNNDNKSYSWTINYDNNVSIIDNNNDCSIGLAFVLLSYSNAYMAGIDEAKEGIKETFDLLEEKYWESNNNLYADSYNSNGILQNYRGQNSNMHLVEAFISAFDATNDRKYLLKAYLIAESVTIKLSSYDKFNLICEHFSSEKYNSSSSWIIDNEYNKNNCFNENNFHPVGYQPGHLTEWSTLLIRLEDRIIKVFNDGNEDIISKLNTAWIVPRACELFDTAMINGWDDEYGGIICSFVENENNYKNLNNESIIFYDTNKYHWVQAASFSAAAVLFKRTCDNKYSEYYNKIWKYIWENFVDHVDGAWFCTLNQNNSKINNNKCPAGKVDYHSISSCHYSIDAFIS